MLVLQQRLLYPVGLQAAPPQQSPQAVYALLGAARLRLATPLPPEGSGLALTTALSCALTEQQACQVHQCGFGMMRHASDPPPGTREQHSGHLLPVAEDKSNPQCLQRLWAALAGTPYLPRHTVAWQD